MPCSKGKPNENGELCPYCVTEPQTMEGWEAWDVALRCEGQLRMAQFAVIGIDMNAALKVAEALGYCLAVVSELLSVCEAGTVEALNKNIVNAMQK